MGTWTHAIETEFALSIRNDVGTILKVEAHTRDTHFIVVLNAIFITVRKHLADDVGAIGKDAAHYIYLCGCGV